MSKVKEHDIVTISFIGKLDNGAVFIEVPSKKPMSVTVGNSDLPPTVEMAIIGMSIGESKTIRVSADEGFGPRMKELLQEVPLRNFGDKINPKPGMIISQKITKDGVEHKVPATVIEIKDDLVVVDYNHPLAGHPLTYKLTIIDIERPE